MKYLGSTDIGQDLAIKNYIDEGDLVNHPDSVLSADSMKPLENRIISRYLQNVAVNFRYNRETGRFVLLNPFGDEIGNVRFIGHAAVYTPTLLNMSESDNFTIADGANVLLAFNYSSVDTNSADDGPGTAVVTVNGTSTDPFSVIQGSNTFNVTDLLSDGENIISIRAENSEHLVASLFYKVNVLSVKISANLCAQNAYFGDTAIEYVVRGSDSKVVHFEMDGIDIGTSTVTTSGKPSIFNIPAQNPGVHQLRVYAVGNQNGQTITSNILSYGMVYADEAMPEIQLAANQHAVRFFDIDGTCLYGYAANDGDAIADPVTQNLISAPTREGTTDTQYAYSGWGNVPATITEDYAAVASYTTSYLVTFMNLATQFATQWVTSGSAATTPTTDPTRAETTTYGYRFNGWTTDPEGTAVQTDALTNVIAPRTVYAVFTQLAKHTVRFMNGTTVLQTVIVLDGENAAYTGADPVHPTEPDDMRFMGWEPSAESVTADVDCQPVWLDTSSKTRKILQKTISGYYENSLPKKITDYEFAYCSGLVSVSFANVEYVGSSAFLECGNLRRVDMPKVTQIMSSAFNTARNLSEISFNNALTILGSFAFYRTGLSSAIIPNVARVEDFAFYECASLETVSLNQASMIGSSAFERCYNLLSISAPNVAVIHSTAFRYCSSLSVVSLPNIRNISWGAFMGCSNLSALILPGDSIPALSKSALSSTHSSLKIYVPNSMISFYQSGTNWSEFSSAFHSIDEYEGGEV